MAPTQTAISNLGRTRPPAPVTNVSGLVSGGHRAYHASGGSLQHHRTGQNGIASANLPRQDMSQRQTHRPPALPPIPPIPSSSRGPSATPKTPLQGTSRPKTLTAPSQSRTAGGLGTSHATVPASKSTLEKYSAAYTRYMAHRSSRPPIARNGQSETSDPTGTKLRLAMELAKDAMIRNNPGIPREDLMAQARQAAPNAAGSAAQRVEASASVARKGAPKAATNTSTPSRPTGYMQQVLSGNTQGQQGTPPQMSQPGTSFLGGATKYFR